MFDSPFEFCKVCKEYVLLDQTLRQCAREHRCADPAVPPAPLFHGHRIRRAEASEEARPKVARGQALPQQTR